MRLPSCLHRPSLSSLVARNPVAGETVQPVGLTGVAPTEAIALFALIVAFIILFVG